MYHNLKILLILLIAVFSSVGYLLTGQQEGTSQTIGKTFQNQSRRGALAFERMPSEGPGPLLDLTSLTEEADLIVVGQIVSVQDERRKVTPEGEASQDQRIAASLKVMRTLKGPAISGLLEFESFPAAIESGYAVLRPEQFGMFFLRNLKGIYSVLSPYYPFVIAPHQAHASRKGDDLDHVVAEIAYILSDPDASEEERRKAVYVLDSARVGSATEALILATRDPDTVVRLQALAALLKRNDISQLHVIENILLGQPANIQQYLRGNLAAALEGIKDSRAIPVLTHLLSASEVRVRQGAIGALRHMGAVGASGPLIIALNDSNRQVRYEAVIGLAELTGQSEWAPSVEVFQKEEERYLSHWREWARTQ